MKKLGTWVSAFTLIIGLLLAGCGGGGNSATGSNNNNNTQLVTGIAATGTPLTGTVYLKDSSSPAKEISSIINSDGSFSFDVTSLTAPFILKAVGTANGQNYTLYSLAGTPGVANINPLSHLAVVQANGGVDPASLYAAPTPAQLHAIKTALLVLVPQIQALLQQPFSLYGVAATTNFISDAYTANHMGLDLLFDVIAIVANNGNLTMTNKLDGSNILTTTLNGNTLSGQIVTANIPIITNQSLGDIYVYPTSFYVAAGGTVTFKAIFIGKNNQSVTWSVVEPGGGSISSTGVYTAPNTAGTYTVKATSVADTKSIDTQFIIVTSPGGHGTGVNGLMGGAIQGNALTLSNSVSTLAGKANVSNPAGGMPVGAHGSSDATGAAASFYDPNGITTDGINLYVADSANNTIRKIVISTGAVTTLAGTAGQSGYANGTGTATKFNYPQGITTDGTNLYVADTNNSTIRKIVISTGAVTTLAGGQFGSSDGLGTAAKFNYSQGITTDGTNLYVADTNNSTIRKIVISTGAVTTLAGTAGVSGHADGYGIAATFGFPYGITTDGTNLYVTDSVNNTIRKIVISTRAVTTIAGTFNPGSTDSIGTAASFYYPEGITTDGTNLYVTDEFNGTIRKIVISSGSVTTIVGTAGGIGSNDGIGALATFYDLRGITTDGTSLYVADETNNTIRKIK